MATTDAEIETGGIMRMSQLAVVATMSLMIACSTTTRTTTEPEVRTKGSSLVQYEGPEVRAELNHRWASTHLGDELLVLKLTLVGTGGQSVMVEGDSVTLRTPEGRTLPMIDQREFERLEGRLRVPMDRLDAWGPPSARFTAFEQPCDQWFVAPQASFADRWSLLVGSGRWCSGPAVFHVPMGVQPGRWVLVIDLEESSARIPFVLEEDPDR